MVFARRRARSRPARTWVIGVRRSCAMPAQTPRTSARGLPHRDGRGGQRPQLARSIKAGPRAQPTGGELATARDICATQFHCEPSRASVAGVPEYTYQFNRSVLRDDNRGCVPGQKLPARAACNLSVQPGTATDSKDKSAPAAHDKFRLTARLPNRNHVPERGPV